jgi:hypothetical protein
LGSINSRLIYVPPNVATNIPKKGKADAESDLAGVNRAEESAPAGPSLAGIYDGLFAPAANPGPNNSGFFTFTVGRNGAFSGGLLLGAERIPFAGAFDASGAAALNLPHGRQTLAIRLQLNTSGAGTNRVGGDIFALNWDAAVSGVLASGATAGLAGDSAMVLPGASDAATAPGGDGFSRVNLSAHGVVTAIGRLGDGAAFAQSARVSEEGLWPFYACVPAGREVAFGWLAFGTNGGDITGAVTWVKPPGAGLRYPDGFALSQTVLSSPFLPPAKGTPVLSLADPVVTLAGGNLETALTNTVGVARDNVYTNGTIELTLSVNPVTGTFTGRFMDPATGSPRGMAGVALEGQHVARGYFLGTNESGAVLLEEQQP